MSALALLPAASTLSAIIPTFTSLVTPSSIVGAVILAWWPNVVDALNAHLFQGANLTVAVGDELFGTEQFDEAEKVYNALLSKNPSYTEKLQLLTRLGNIAHRKGSDEEALRFYNEVLNLASPDEVAFADARFNRALVYLERGAEGDLERAYKGLVTAHDLYVNLSYEATAQGEYDAALGHLDSAFSALNIPAEHPVGTYSAFGKILVERAFVHLHKMEPEEAWEAGELADGFFKLLGHEEYMTYSILSKVSLSQAAFMQEGKDELVLEIYRSISERLAFISAQIVGRETFPEAYRETLGIDLNVLKRFVTKMLEGGVEAIRAYRDEIAVRETEITILDLGQNRVRA